MTSFAVGVVAHHTRRRMADQLAAQTDATYVSVDDGTVGANVNHQKVWTYLANLDTEWSLCLEDDAVPVGGFTVHTAAALTHAPAPIISFYLGTGRPPHWQNRISDAVAKADVNQTAWIMSTHLLHAVAVAARTELIPGMLTYLARRRYYPIDEAITQWARRTNQPIAYTHGSLVDHMDGPTIERHRDGQPRLEARHAWTLTPPDHWDTPVTVM
jgi:hypothetical protein